MDEGISPLTTVKLENLTVEKYLNPLEIEGESISPMTKMSKIFFSC